MPWMPCLGGLFAQPCFLVGPLDVFFLPSRECGLAFMLLSAPWLPSYVVGDFFGGVASCFLACNTVDVEAL